MKIVGAIKFVLFISMYSSLFSLNFYLDAPFDDQHQRCICKWKRRRAEVYSESEFVPVYISKGTWPVSGEEGMAEKLFYISD